MIFEVTYARFETLREKSVGSNFRHNHQWYRVAEIYKDEVRALKTKYRRGPVTHPNPYSFVEEA